MQPYFLYTEPIIETQTKTLEKSFHSLWRKSFKQFMGSNLPSETLERIFYFKNQICAIANAKTRRKVSTRFGVPLDEGLQQDGEVVLTCLKMFQNNFKLLYAFSRKHFRFHQKRMNCNNTFSYDRLGFAKWLEGLLAVPKRLLTGWKKKQRSSAWRRYHERFLQCFVDKVQQKTATEGQSGEGKRANSQPTEMLTLCRRD